MKKADPKASVCISNEYGQLYECIVGIGNGRSANGHDWSEMEINGRKLTEMLSEEEDQLISVLEKNSVEVVRPDVLSDEKLKEAYGPGADKNALCQTFPRNNCVIVANDLIEFELQDVNRKTDILGLYGILNKRSKDSRICWYSTPHCALRYTPDDYPSLDGGDFIFLDDKILIGVHSNGKGTNAEGFRWMRNTFAFHDVRSIELPDWADSLGQVLSVPRPGVVAVCRDAVKELPSYMEGWEIIEISKEEAECYSADILPVSEKVCVIGYSDRFDNERLAEALSQKGIEVIAIDTTAHMELGGSVRSMTMALRRSVV